MYSYLFVIISLRAELSFMGRSVLWWEAEAHQVSSRRELTADMTTWMKATPQWKGGITSTHYILGTNSALGTRYKDTADHLHLSQYDMGLGQGPSMFACLVWSSSVLERWVTPSLSPVQSKIAEMPVVQNLGTDCFDLFVVLTFCNVGTIKGGLNQLYFKNWSSFIIL